MKYGKWINWDAGRRTYKCPLEDGTLFEVRFVHGRPSIIPHKPPQFDWSDNNGASTITAYRICILSKEDKLKEVAKEGFSMLLNLEYHIKECKIIFNKLLKTIAE